MAENYVVNYEINVRAQQGIESIRKFQEATMKLDECGRKLLAFQKKIESVSAKFSQMAKKAPVFDISTSKANKKLDSVIVKLEKIHRLAKKVAVLNVSSSSNATVIGKGSSTSSITPIVTPRTTKVPQRIIPKNIGYLTLGQTMIDSGGIGAFNMMKGMGVAYGMSGLGALMGGIVRDSSEYDNIMKTTQNILKTHDRKPMFDQRFKEMEQIVRNVGIETKFTAPQVADAGKFLAMAGFDLDAINKSIRPISDIALVGDTDLGETADVVTNIMTGYNIKPDKVRNAADIIAMTFTKSNTTLMEIAEAYKYSASLLSAGGVPFEEATAGLGILGDAGIKGSQAGTTFRTIMANIVNPTKKQLGEWKRIGVKRFDKNGNVRSLTSIFEDLNKADLHIEDFYKLFHKTAAQGAVSLTQNVDKWNDIIYENFLSEGLVAKLAEEKKNTIQGLWYQLTSAFTENGIQAFEELQQPIKGMMNEVIMWLKTPEALQMIKDLSKVFFDMIVMLKDVTYILLNLYIPFKGIVNTWIKFQVYAWPILNVFRAFKAFFTSVGFVMMFAGKISFLTGKIQGLCTALMKLKLTGSAGTLFQNISSFFAGNYLSGARNISPQVLARYQRMHSQRPIINWGKGAGVLGGGFIGGLAGAKLGEGIGGETGMLIGGISGSLLGSLGGSTLVTLFSNPVGWALLASAAIGGIAYYFKQYHDKVEECTQANNLFLSSTQAVNGINMSEHATMADKYLSIVYNKQLDTNQAIGEHINLMREQLGLMKQAEQDLKDQVPFKDSHKDIYDNANQAFGYWGTKEERYKAATSPIYDSLGNIDRAMSVFEASNLDNYGTSKSLNFNGVDFGNVNNDMYDNLAAARLLYGMGRDTSAGTPTRALIDSYHKRALSSGSVEDFNSVIKDLVSSFEKKQYVPGSEKWSLEQVGENSSPVNQRGYHYLTAQRNTLYDNFRWDHPSTAEAYLMSTLQKILTNNDLNKPIPEDLLKTFLLQSGVDIFNESRYGKFGSNEFMKSFGWSNNKWNAGKFSFFNKTTGQNEDIYLTSDEARKHFLSFHQEIIDTVKNLNPKLRSYFNSFINSSIWDYEDVADAKEGDRKNINGVWNEYKFNSPKGKYEWVPLADQLGPGTTGADESKYKSHYQSGSAAPKQIIVKIENLMNVKSIDLANPDNAAVIENIKGQLTQALVDVVHDFDNTFHG